MKTLPKTKTETWVVHALMSCEICEWYEEDFTTAESKARYHTRVTGHTTRGEVGRAVVIRKVDT